MTNQNISKIFMLLIAHLFFNYQNYTDADMLVFFQSLVLLKNIRFRKLALLLSSDKTVKPTLFC
jgi:hypothetical protein